MGYRIHRSHRSTTFAVSHPRPGADGVNAPGEGNRPERALGLASCRPRLHGNATRAARGDPSVDVGPRDSLERPGDRELRTKRRGGLRSKELSRTVLRLPITTALF